MILSKEKRILYFFIALSFIIQTNIISLFLPLFLYGFFSGNKGRRNIINKEKSYTKTHYKNKICKFYFYNTQIIILLQTIQ